MLSCEYNEEFIRTRFDYYTGLELQSIGMRYVSNTDPTYKYITENYSGVEQRYNFSKAKMGKLLENFDPSLTEWENMRNHGFDRIWDCGNDVFVWTL